MELITSSSTENPTGGHTNNEYIGVNVRVVSTNSNNYVLVEEFDSSESDKKHVLVSATYESKPEVDNIESKERYQSDDNYDQQEESEELEKKLMILADASKLKLLAKNFLHPNEKIGLNGLMGRCFFDRASAPEVMSKEESDIRAMILADAKALEAYAVGYFNPDIGIDEVDPTIFGRNYFTFDEESKERIQILSDAFILKKYASDYLHPEVKVVNDDSTLFGCNYFNRISSLEAM